MRFFWKKLYFALSSLKLVALVFFSACGAIDFQYQAPSSMMTPNSAAYLAMQAAESRLRLGSREFINSHLEQLFGTLTTGQRALILSQGPVVGGAEDFYEGLNRGNMDAAIIPVSVSAREAFRIRVCNSVVQTDVQVETALSRIYGVSGAALTALKQRRPETLRELATAYAAFFPGKSPDEDVLDSLKDLTIEANRNNPANAAINDAWRMLLLVLCLDPTWQIL